MTERGDPLWLDVDIDFRVSGLPHAVVKQAENSRVRELVKKIENHPHRQALQADLQQNNAYNPFSEKSQKMIQDMDNVELFELCETIPQVQCSECLLYWNQGIVYCTCGHLLRENQSSRGILRWTLDLLSIPTYVIKKVRPHGHRCVKTKEQRENLLPIIWDRDASRKVLKGSTIASKTIPYFVNLNSALIELKKSASRWTRTRRKISPVEWRKKSTFDAKRIGGSLSISLEKSDRWEIVLTSTKRWPNYTVLTKSLEKSDSHQFLTGSTRNGIRRLLHPAHLGGSGTIPGGAHDN